MSITKTAPKHSTQTASDPRPPIWIGHVQLNVTNFQASLDFFLSLGMRYVASFQGLAVLELRGGTHLILLQTQTDAAPPPASFDLMVDDLAGQHAALQAVGHQPEPIYADARHRRFTVVEPSGNRLIFCDTHVAGPV